MYCRNCGKEIDDKAVVCVHCGVSTTPLLSYNRNSWLVALLLCFFLGYLGAHRFYTGYKGSAVAQLILSITFIGMIISGPWILIDFIMILCGQFKTADGENLI